MDKTCTKCGGEYPATIEYFHRDGKRLRAECKQCKTQSVKECHKTRNGKLTLIRSCLKKRYGITLTEYNKMFKKQNGVCVICKKPETVSHHVGVFFRLSVDHNHKTGKIRGLLCLKCNRAIGLFEHKIKNLQKAINYLKRKINMAENIGGIKIEPGEKREFDTGAKKQSAKNKGTPVLFPPDAYLEISKHFEDGAAIYSPRNWEKGIPLSELINSLERHIAQEKMGLTDEKHDRALAWCAVTYLATKLRIQAGILPLELADLCGVYVGESEKDESKYTIAKAELGWYVCQKGNSSDYLYRDLKFHNGTGHWSAPAGDSGPGYYETKKAAQKTLQKYLQKGGE